MDKTFGISLGLAASLLLGSVHPVQAIDMKVHGSSAVYHTIMTPNLSDIEDLANQRINLVSQDSGAGLSDLVTGKADVDMISAPLADVVDRLDKKVEIGELPLIAHHIGATRVAFAVNRLNPVRRLTLDQIVDILAGRTTNWRDVGGRDAPIEVITQLRSGGVRTVVDALLSASGDAIVNPTTVQTAEMAAFAVSQVPNGLALTTVAAIDKQMQAMVLTDRPIEQPMFLVTQGDPDIWLQRLIQAVRQVNKWEPRAADTRWSPADEPSLSSLTPESAEADSSS